MKHLKKYNEEKIENKWKNTIVIYESYSDSWVYVDGSLISEWSVTIFDILLILSEDNINILKYKISMLTDHFPQNIIDHLNDHPEQEFPMYDLDIYEQEIIKRKAEKEGQKMGLF